VDFEASTSSEAAFTGHLIYIWLVNSLPRITE